MKTLDSKERTEKSSASQNQRKNLPTQRGKPQPSKTFNAEYKSKQREDEEIKN